jgi:hypothetical protein
MFEDVEPRNKKGGRIILKWNWGRRGYCNMHWIQGTQDMAQ